MEYRLCISLRLHLLGVISETWDAALCEILGGETWDAPFFEILSGDVTFRKILNTPRCIIYDTVLFLFRNLETLFVLWLE